MKLILFFIAFIIMLPVFAMDYGIDRLQEIGVAEKLKDKNLAVLTHAAGRSKQGHHLIDELHQNFNLKKIFAPEHGLRTMADDWVEDGQDEATGLPVVSLYKRGSKAPKPEDLKGIDAIVIDLQDVGVRYYTYFSTIAEVMKAVAPLNIEVIILDRPNLLGGDVMEGKVLDKELAGNFTAYHTIPTRHGMTLGELALMINKENKLGTKLTVVPVQGWKREYLLTSLDRPWLAPSPALVSLAQVGLYALWGSLENFNLSVGRGQTNEEAFRILGAPWISSAESQELAQELNQLNFPGLQFKPIQWKVTRSIFVGQEALGVRIEGDFSLVRTDEFTFKVASLLVDKFKDRITMNQMSPQTYGSLQLVEAIRRQEKWEKIRIKIDQELEAFAQRRKPFLLY
jgi:uncharacterized protein YbbC (DUF1343 family)